jgi:hypothetical protein
MLGLSYLEQFQKQRFWSNTLQNKDKLDRVLQSGFMWIRRCDDRHFENITRRPTVGCYVEVFKLRHSDCVPIQSREGKKLIGKVCYF